MRTRDEIEDDCTTAKSMPNWSEDRRDRQVLILEVLLDIREMLMPLAHPVYEVDVVTNEAFTTLFRTPTGDIVTTKEVKSESKTDSKN